MELKAFSLSASKNGNCIQLLLIILMLVMRMCKFVSWSKQTIYAHILIQLQNNSHIMFNPAPPPTNMCLMLANAYAYMHIHVYTTETDRRTDTHIYKHFDSQNFN